MTLSNQKRLENNIPKFLNNLKNKKWLDQALIFNHKSSLNNCPIEKEIEQFVYKFNYSISLQSLWCLSSFLQLILLVNKICNLLCLTYINKHCPELLVFYELFFVNLFKIIHAYFFNWVQVQWVVQFHLLCRAWGSGCLWILNKRRINLFILFFWSLWFFFALSWLGQNVIYVYHVLKVF